MNLRRCTQTLCLAAALIAQPALSSAGVFFSITIAPPLLPVYVQPVCPGDGYIWMPGYWAYGPAGYYWVPGTWVLAARPGLLWTPGYWAFGGGVYLWHAGYWGPHVGFYGGVNYGFGYTGIGFSGGFWSGGYFHYNRSVTNVNITNVHNVYNQTVINNTTVNRTSFNGPGGITARPTPTEQIAAREQHVAPTATQLEHERAAASNRALLASVNHGVPAHAAMARPISQNRFAAENHPMSPNRPGVDHRAATYNPPARPNSRPVYANASPAREHPPASRAEAERRPAGRPNAANEHEKR